MAVFTWTPSPGVTGDPTPRVLSASYGDGYEQRVGDGINNVRNKFNLSFNSRLASEADAILQFLKDRKGIESFDWTPPGGVLGKYICKKWSFNFSERTTQKKTVTAIFEEWFG